MDFVINEWMLDYFLPNAMPIQKQQQSQFIKRFFERRDRIVVISPSPFTIKAEDLASRHQNYPVYPQIKFFITEVLRKPSRASLVGITDTLPPKTHAALYESGRNYKSDEYLFHAALRTETKLIITTDERLRNALADDEVFKVMLLADFLEDY